VFERRCAFAGGFAVSLFGKLVVAGQLQCDGKGVPGTLFRQYNAFAVDLKANPVGVIRVLISPEQ
jgi:hypothetical protein